MDTAYGKITSYPLGKRLIILCCAYVGTLDFIPLNLI